MARLKNSPESEASIQSLRNIRNAVFEKMAEKHLNLTMVTSVGIPGNTTLRLERGGGARGTDPQVHQPRLLGDSRQLWCPGG